MARVQEGDPAQRDLTVTITDVCVADCTAGPVQVGVQVTNRGGIGVLAGRPLSLYALSDNGAVLVKVITLPAVPAATAMEGFQVDVPIGQLGNRGFRAVIDDDGTGAGTLAECDDGNNVDEWWDVFCP